MQWKLVRLTEIRKIAQFRVILYQTSVPMEHPK